VETFATIPERRGKKGNSKRERKRAREGSSQKFPKQPHHFLQEGREMESESNTTQSIKEVKGKKNARGITKRKVFSGREGGREPGKVWRGHLCIYVLPNRAQVIGTH